ncbi:hypothetical protein [Nocardioides dilutus]
MTRNPSDESILEEEWLAAPRRRSRLRTVLAGLLAASVCFLGGTLVQKHFGTDSSAAAAGPAGLPEGLPEGFPGAGGQLPGGGGVPTSADGPADATAEGAADDAGAVVGTVVGIDGEVWIVEDLGGERHEVLVTDDSDVVRETPLTRDQVAVGDRVDISGTRSDGQLTAEDVTLR